MITGNHFVCHHVPKKPKFTLKIFLDKCNLIGFIALQGDNYERLFRVN